MEIQTKRKVIGIENLAPRRPTKRAADRPVGAIFRLLVLKTAISVQSVALAGRRLTQAVGLAASSVCCSSSPPSRVPPPATHRNRRAPHTTAHVICARRPTFSLQPATICPSPASCMLRRWCTSRFASGCTARHGYHISVSARVFALQEALR
jgi:hypothetical protein